MNFANISYEIEGGILYLALNRPDVRNALTPEMWADIRSAIRMAKRDPAIKVIIISGKGGKAFASGADIRILRDRAALEVLLIETQDILREVENIGKPVICAIDGFALGGGCELAMACDIRIATARSKFGQPEVNLGLIPGAGGTQRLTRLIGVGKAKELIFTGEIIAADEALALGLINKVVEDETSLMAAAGDMANKIIAKGPVAVMAAKLAINGGTNVDLDTGMLLERLAQTVAFGTQDRLEGTSAFIEKRTPVFQGK